MDNFECLYMEAALEMDKINHFWESTYDTFAVTFMETTYSSVIEENTKDLILMEETESLGKKVVAAIQKIMDAIASFCSKIKDAIVSKFTSKEQKEKEEKIREELKKNPEAANKKLKVIRDEKNVELLNTYIREMAKLERKLMNIKAQATDGFKSGNSKDAQLVISANQILREMDKLDEKFDKEFLHDNEETIEMALKDAIRFSDKQLENVKVDFDAVEKESSRILAEFKKDAQGCDVPVKYNIIQKMANAVGTRTRKYIEKKTRIKKKNNALIIASALTILGISAVETYKTNPAVKQGVDNIAQITGADKVAANVKGKITSKLQQLQQLGSNP